MSAKVHTNIMVRANKIPFHVLPNDEELESHTKSQNSPRLKNVVDRLMGNLRRHRRYINQDGEFKHHRLADSSTSVERDECLTPIRARKTSKVPERSSSLEKISGLVVRNEFLDFKPPSEAFMGRRRSRSDSDLLVSCEIFARRRAAICEEMERNLLMENGVTLRKCRKNLVLNQILENLSLL